MTQSCVTPKFTVRCAFYNIKLHPTQAPETFRKGQLDHDVIQDFEIRAL